MAACTPAETTSLSAERLSIRSASQETPAEWWILTLDLQSQAYRIGNEPDRQFLRSMINKLAVSEDAMPSRLEQFWLLSIRKELQRRR